MTFSFGTTRIVWGRQHTRIGGRLSGLIRAEQGTSAIEFALLAPVLILAVLGTVDVGRALAEQMSIGSLLRSGAQSAVAGADIATVDRVLRAAAENNFALAAPGSECDENSLCLQVSHSCACADDPGTPAACSTTCAGSQPTAVYYTIAGAKTFSGVFLDDISLSRSLKVQVR